MCLKKAAIGNMPKKSYNVFKKSYDLLEKSRVFSQLPGERSYHIFYQLLRGASPQMKARLGLKPPKEYHVLSKSKSHEVRDAYMGGENSSDEADYNTVVNAMNICGFSVQVV